MAYNTKVATEQSDVLWPMTQWGDERLEAVSGEQVPNWLRHYMAANAVVKYAKTVGSVQTHVRNARGKRDSARMLTRKLSSRGEVPEDELRESFDSAVRSHRELFKDMHESARAAIALGMTREEVVRVLDASGVAKQDAVNIVKGRFVPYRPSSSFFSGVMESAVSTGMSRAEKGRIRSKYRERAELLELLYEGEEVID